MEQQQRETNVDVDVEAKGLSTSEALHYLYEDIEQVLNQYVSSKKSRRTKSWLNDAVSHRNQHTIFCWTSAVALLLSAVALIVSYVHEPESTSFLGSALIIVLLTVLDLLLVLFDNRLRHYELPKRVRQILTAVERLRDVRWLPEHYPNLCSPFSPCITLQWTYRDGIIVNLPWALLVKNDVVIIRPGQLSPGYCEALEKNDEYSLLHAKEVYGPSLMNPNEAFTAPKACTPLGNKMYRMLETPYLNNLRIALEQALDRPITHHNQQRHLVMVKCVEMIAFPVMLFIVFVAGFVRFVYLEHYLGIGSWIEYFILVPVATTLPLLPIVFPIAWIVLNCLGIARFKSLLDATLSFNEEYEPYGECDLVNAKNRPELKYIIYGLWNTFIGILLGNEDILSRSVNIVHILGSVTALCCVDKKGILSWPNPTAEKIFFLRNADNISQSSSLANLGELNTDTDSLHGTSTGGTTHSYHHDQSSCTLAEVLDLTNDQSKLNKLYFDDVDWHRHINSLKPLGLSILLNTCNIETQDNYLEFCSHITCEAMYNENLIPVTNRRCLCELAKEIGFVDEAQKIFTLEQQLSSFRHLQPEMVRRDNKFARSLQLSTKLKFPFPHMVAVVVKEQSSGSLQLLSQGTADIILDSCVDYWDGHDLCPLASADRKKIQDFYQRTSLTAYCTAFAYRPLNRKVNSKVSSLYLELPSDSKHLYVNHRSPTPVHWDCRSVLEPKIKASINQFYSTDSLLYNDSPCPDVTDTESCFEMQCNQVFIGMVTMQYQAQADMVQLIEQLEGACIRFVHFSKENELRSRVFSEKMGLESGWNCHISLMSERVSNLESSRTMSFSAPSAINMEHSVVKFDTERETLVKKPSSPQSIQRAECETAASQDSVLVQPTDMNSTTHDWQSLSCLTDSTEQSAPVNFYMANRAKLPRGIDKIRPHIEMIDNVPLLVSLFTDCTATVTREMLNIMQDYGEVVCVIGSSANSENMGIFMQADASIAIEPLYPQVCQKIPPYLLPKDCLSPIELARTLNSIPCSLSLRREDPISLHHLVMESRHCMLTLWSAVQFWLCCCVCLSFMQLTAAVLMLPPLLTPGQVVWECCVIVPLLSVSLIGVPTDANVMKKPLGKNHIVFNIEVAGFVLWCYGIKFLPIIFVVIGTFASNLAILCNDYCSLQNCTCTLYYLPNVPENSAIVRGYSLFITQHLILILILIHFVIVSMSFIHREHSIWSRSPHVNFLWISTTIFLFVLQILYTTITLHLNENNDETTSIIPSDVIIAFVCLSPMITFIIMELVKRHEIKVNLRYQRRARLDFGTKLGMNSPF